MPGTASTVRAADCFSPPDGPAECPGWPERWLRRGAEVCLALAVLAPPFIFGARQAYGQLILAILVLAASGLCVLRQFFYGCGGLAWRRAEVLLPLAGMALCVCQWVPLPFRWIQVVSPGMGRLLPGWVAHSLPGLDAVSWPCLSLVPGLSRETTWLFLLDLLLFWATLDTVRALDSVRRVLRVLFLAGVGVAAVGIVNYLFWNGKFYGLWEVWWVEPERQVRAPFTNRNHFAGFLALALAPGMATLLWLVLRRQQARGSARAFGTKGDSPLGAGGQSPFVPNALSQVAPQDSAAHAGRPPGDLRVVAAGLGVTLILAGILLSRSRGGAVVGVLALAVAALRLLRLDFRQPRVLLTVAFIALAGLALVLMFGGGQTFQRVGTLVNGDQPLDALSNGRLALWKADLHALWDFPVLGCGAGTHRYVYPLYFSKLDPKTYTHAENGYVQVVMECGLVGAVLLAALVFTLCRWCRVGLLAGGRRGSDPAAPWEAAVGVSLLVSMVHGLVDFVWYVPAYAAAVSLLAGLACSFSRHRQALFPRDSRPPAGRAASRPVGFLWGVTLATIWGVLAVVLGTHFVENARAEYAWNSYYSLLPPNEAEDQQDVRHQDLAGQSLWLAEACVHRQAEPDYFYRLGLVEEQQFAARTGHGQRPLAMLDLRQAFGSQHFAAPGEGKAWLGQRYGDGLTLLEQAQSHFRRALTCSPLLGPAYVRLAELSFLDTPQGTPVTPYLQQALVVRPNDPQVSFEVGVENWLANDWASAGLCWQRTCQLDPGYQNKLLPVLSKQLPVGKVVDLVHPDFDGLRWLAHEQFKRGQQAAERDLAAQALAALKGSDRRRDPDDWIALHELYQEADMPETAEACLHRALALGPGEPECYVRLIRWFMERERWDEAVAQTRRALVLFPDLPEIQALQADLLSKKTRTVKAPGPAVVPRPGGKG